jgi:hypothetical protein
MNAPSTRRPAFPARPWITGKAYDDYSRDTVLHCDAYLYADAFKDYLVVSYRVGGRKLIALDGYLAEPDGLTPIWDVEALVTRANVRRAFWTRSNHALMRRIHKNVLNMAREANAQGQYQRVTLLCHYVRVTDEPCEPGQGAYKTPKRRAMQNSLPDIL